VAKSEPAKTRAARKPLDRDRIERAALALIDRTGVNDFSLRTLAKELKVEPMSLYHWYPSKAHLLDALVDRIVGGMEVPRTGSFERRIAATSRSFRKAVCAHPGFTPYLVLHRFNTHRAIAALDTFLSIFHDAGMDPRSAATSFRFLIHWLMGFCLDETAGFSKGPSAVDPPSAEVVKRAFPHVAALEPFNKPEHFDALFEAGLKRILSALSDSVSRG
jgi:AcrR family transcriptional regulator